MRKRMCMWDNNGMDLDWLWKSIFARIVWAVLALVGGAMLTRLKKRGSAWFAPILWGIGGTGLIAATLLALALLLTVPLSTQEHITTDNVEPHIRGWLDAFGVAVKKEASNADSYFILTVTLRNGNPVLISRPKLRDHYLMLQSSINISPEHKAIISKMSPGQLMRLVDQVELEMARSGIGHTLNGPPLESVIITKSVPIGDSLSESVFAGYLDVMDNGMNLARESISQTCHLLTSPRSTH